MEINESDLQQASGASNKLLELTVELARTENMLLMTRDFYYESQEGCKRCTSDKSCSFHKNFASVINLKIADLGAKAKAGIDTLAAEYYSWCKEQLVNESQPVPRKEIIDDAITGTEEEEKI